MASDAIVPSCADWRRCADYAIDPIELPDTSFGARDLLSMPLVLRRGFSAAGDNWPLVAAIAACLRQASQSLLLFARYPLHLEIPSRSILHESHGNWHGHYTRRF